VRLTEAGRLFLGESRAVLDRVEAAAQAARAIATGGGGELNVGYAPSPTARILPPTLRAFRSALPRVRVKLHDLSTGEMLAGLRDGELHIAILIRPTRAMLRGLRFEALARDSMRLAVPPAHEFARLRSVSLARLVSQPFVALSREGYPEYHEWLAEFFARMKRKPRIVEEFDSIAGMVAAVEAGCGLALAAQSLACSIGPRLKLIPVSPAPEPLVVGAAWAKPGLTVPAERFLRCAREAASVNE
jgi:DNA-binding transcriptional LysR family regulator